MKVAIVIEHFNPKRGGAETYTACLVDRLVADDHDVHVFAQDWTNEPARVTMIRVPLKGVTAAGRALSFATEASELTAEGGFDVVHSMARIMRLSVFQPHSGVMKASLERTLGYSKSPISKGARQVARWLNTKIDMMLELEGIIYGQSPPPRVVAVSNMVASDIKKAYDVPDSKIDVVYNGVDTARFRPENRQAYHAAVRDELGIAHDDVLLLFVGHDYKRKGADVFIRVVSETVKNGNKNVKGLVVGGRDSGAYRTLADKLGVGDRMIFHEAVWDIERYYAAADIYLLPTYYDPMSLVVLEAMASGLPVITTRLNGCSEIITDGVQGFTVNEPREIGAMVSAVTQMLDRHRRTEMGQAARALAEEFPFERNYQGILEVYRKAASEGPPTGVEIRKGQ